MENDHFATAFQEFLRPEKRTSVSELTTAMVLMKQSQEFIMITEKAMLANAGKRLIFHLKCTASILDCTPRVSCYIGRGITASRWDEMLISSVSNNQSCNYVNFK